jgi:1-acyl-sn-glycerol-3-phosphate acyltransferase
VSVDGLEHVPSRPAVIVANHASYVDWLLLSAVLPAQASFVAKRELSTHRALRWLLERVGTRFVTCDDVHRSVEDAKALVDAARAGETLVFFPEGTLARTPGLRPFHMGAFVVSADSGLPLLPVSLHGTRSVLHAAVHD